MTLKPSAFRPRRQNSHKGDAEKRCPPFLQWLRGRPCLVGGQCVGKMQACHVDYAGDKGMGTKASDRFAVAMCAGHHAESHNAGIRTFEARHNVNLLSAARHYWRMWPGRRAWEAER